MGGGGIIPARAGFTVPYLPPTLLPPDHPRSRGVYQRRRPANARVGGSSPLARGLHYDAGDNAVYIGIIPARAGFTRSWRSPIIVLADHPRSRGVYSAGRDVIAKVAGSSPLARGLPHYAPYHQERKGIIPARAGFTFEYFQAPPLSHGSSPLARGLLSKGNSDHLR